MRRQAALKRLKDKLAARNVKVKARIDTKAPPKAHRWDSVKEMTQGVSVPAPRRARALATTRLTASYSAASPAPSASPVQSTNKRQKGKCRQEIKPRKCTRLLIPSAAGWEGGGVGAGGGGGSGAVRWGGGARTKLFLFI